jgi:pimeloyl-ACP methyl ester carboxylesterase
MKAKRLRGGCMAAIVAIALIPSGSSATHQKIANPGSKRIEEAGFIKLGGLEQWITIRGDNDAAPVLLLLHGGPGDVQSPFVDTYKAYETNFILVQWDQRGAGKTFGKYGEQTPDLTLDQLTSDGIELAAYLKSRFRRDGIILLGHSWGTAIATEMVKKRSDLFLAYVGTGQIASWAESVQWQFDFLKRKASDTNDQELLKTLTGIGTPDPDNTTQYFSFTQPLRNYLIPADSAWLAGLKEFVKGLPKMNSITLLGE